MASFCYNDKTYDVDIIRKSNKNTYIRVKNDRIVITTNYLTSNNRIEKLLLENNTAIIKMIIKSEQKKANDENFSLFGHNYNIIYGNIFKKTEIVDNKIYTLDEKQLNKYLSLHIKTVFTERLDKIYNTFNEEIPKPSLKIRKMTSRWGVCNTKNKTITLNLELSKYPIKYLDYVIIHELSHLIYPNHQSDFWLLVSKYCPDYKTIRKELRN